MKQTTTSADRPQPCLKWAEQLNAIHYEDLSFEQRLELHKHLETCPSCRAVKAEYRALDALITGLSPVNPLPEMPARLQELTGVYEEANQPVNEALLQGNSSSPSWTSQALPARQRARRLKRKLNLAAAVLVVAVILSGFLALTAHRASGVAVVNTTSPNTTLAYITTDVSHSTHTIAYAFNYHNGETLWQYDIGLQITGSPFTVGGNVYFPSYDGNVYALNGRTGQPLWHTRVARGSTDFPGPNLLSAGNLIILGNLSGDVYALNAQTGAIVWHNHIANCQNPTTVTTKGNTTTIYLNGTNTCDVVTLRQANNVIYGFADGLYAWNAMNGHLLWHDPQYTFMAQVMVISHGKIYLPAVQGNLSGLDVLDASTGKLLHTLNVPIMPAESTVAANTDTLYVLSRANMLGNSILHAYSLSNDTLLWSKTFTGSNANWGLIVDDGSIYLAGAALYALRASDGALRWQWHDPRSDYLTPDFQANGIVVVVTVTGIYGLQSSTGHQLWQAFRDLPNKGLQGPVAG